MRLLVLGGTGFIGPYVVRLLAERGHEVTIFHRGETEPEFPPSVRHVHDEFLTLPLHADRWDSEPVDVVIDMVPYLDKGGHAIPHFSGIAGRAVAVTSCDVYRAFGRLWRTEPGPPDATPLTEESPLRTGRAGDVDESVAYDNVEVEQALALVPDLAVTIMRLPATYGPGDYQHRLFPYLKRMDDGRPAILVDRSLAGWRWSRGYVENVAAAIALAVEADDSARRVYNVAELHAYSELEWIRRIGASAGWDGEIILVPHDQLPDSLRSRHYYDFSQDYRVDSSRIRRELGYSEIVDEDEALARSIEWERLHPPDADAERFDYDAEDHTLTALGR